MTAHLTDAELAAIEADTARFDSPYARQVLRAIAEVRRLRAEVAASGSQVAILRDLVERKAECRHGGCGRNRPDDPCELCYALAETRFAGEYFVAEAHARGWREAVEQSRPYVHALRSVVQRVASAAEPRLAKYAAAAREALAAIAADEPFEPPREVHTVFTDLATGADVTERERQQSRRDCSAALSAIAQGCLQPERCKCCEMRWLKYNAESGPPLEVHVAAEAIVARPHPSERGVEKLPPREVLGLLERAAEVHTADVTVSTEGLPPVTPQTGVERVEVTSDEFDKIERALGETKPPNEALKGAWARKRGVR